MEDKRSRSYNKVNRKPLSRSEIAMIDGVRKNMRDLIRHLEFRIMLHGEHWFEWSNDGIARRSGVEESWPGRFELIDHDFHTHSLFRQCQSLTPTTPRKKD